MIAVLIPTYKRADKLAALVDNIHATTASPHQIYFIIEVTDGATLEAVKTLDSIDVIGHHGFSCAGSSNAGYAASTEPLIFTGNDDVLFHEGWDLAAIEALIPEPIQMVGVNDGKGRCDCFALIRRSYIQQHSGVYDKPGTLFHPYMHNYCDTELAEYAKHRGIWGEAPDSIVEHLHPNFGKSADPNHPNYVRGRETEAEDRRVYEQRRTAWEGWSTLAAGTASNTSARNAAC